MQLRTLTPTSDNREWQAILDRTPHDFYHTAQYHAFAEEFGEGAARLAVIGDGDRFLAWPYLLRPCVVTGAGAQDGWFDAHSVYGYPGPLAGRDADDAFLAQAMDQLVEHWQKERIVSVFSRLHPILENANTLVRSGWRSVVQRDGTTVSINTTLDDVEAKAYYPQKLRQYINRADRLQMRLLIDEKYERLPDFVRFYTAAMRRNAASEKYYWSEAYFRRLVDVMYPHIKLLLTEIGGQLAAASLFSQYGRIAQAHFVMVNPDFFQLSPGKVAIEHARIWARSHQCRWLHLGGGLGAAEDSLFRFKAEFSRDHHPFETARIVVNETVYREFVEKRREGLNLELASDQPSFFPEYRAPATSMAEVSAGV